MLVLDKDAALDHVIARSLRAAEVVPEAFAVRAITQMAAPVPPAFAAVVWRPSEERERSGRARRFAILAPSGSGAVR